MEVLLRFLHGAAAVMAVPRRPWWCRGNPTADWPNPRGTAEVLNMLKVSAVPPRRSAVLTVFRGATAINDGTTAEARRSWRCHCGVCRTRTAVAPRLRCVKPRQIVKTADIRSPYISVTPGSRCDCGACTA